MWRYLGNELSMVDDWFATSSTVKNKIDSKAAASSTAPVIILAFISLQRQAGLEIAFSVDSANPLK